MERAPRESTTQPHQASYLELRYEADPVSVQALHVVVHIGVVFAHLFKPKGAQIF